MSRKLLALNIALALLCVLAAWRIWDTLERAEARRNAIVGRPLPPAEAELPPLEGPPAPFVPADYLEVAQKFLFAPDRNPEVVIEAASARPMPPLPVAHGVLDLGAGPTVILSEKAGGPQRGYRVGEQFGEFAIAEITPDVIVFEWEGQRVERRLDELKPKKEATDAPQVAAAKPKPPAEPKAAVIGGGGKPGPSDIDMGGGIRACKPGDESPPGTVVGGYKKVVTQTPFGRVCRWEPVG